MGVTVQPGFWDLIEPAQGRKVLESLRVYRDAAERLKLITGDDSPESIALEDRIHDQPELQEEMTRLIKTMRETTAEVIKAVFVVARKITDQSLTGEITNSPLSWEWEEIIFGPGLLADPDVQTILGGPLMDFLAKTRRRPVQ